MASRFVKHDCVVFKMIFSLFRYFWQSWHGAYAKGRVVVTSRPVLLAPRQQQAVMCPTKGEKQPPGAQTLGEVPHVRACCHQLRCVMSSKALPSSGGSEGLPPRPLLGC